MLAEAAVSPMINEPPLSVTFVEAILAPVWNAAFSPTVTLGDARLPALDRSSVPPETVVFPVYVLTAVSSIVPAPALTISVECFRALDVW